MGKMASTQPKKLARLMAAPIHVIFGYLTKKSRVCIWLHENTGFRLEGVICGFDEYMNLVLGDSEEVYETKSNGERKEVRRPVGKLLLKGDNVSLIYAKGDGGGS